MAHRNEAKPQRSVFLSSVFDPGIHEPLREANPGRIWDPRSDVAQAPGRTIEDICRELIRKSELFVGVFDERGGRAPFEAGIAPVTVLEIELLQALFQRMPVYIFTLPGFERNIRLVGIVDFARRHGQAVIHACGSDTIDDCGSQRKQLTPRGIALISRAIREPFPQRTSRMIARAARHLGPYAKLDVSLLDNAHSLADPFDAGQVARHLHRASLQTDHAARLAYLWPALRQLLSVPYTAPQHASHRPAWETLASAWDRSAAWYGLHDDSPMGKLAAVNTLLWLLGHSELRAVTADFARGARASGFYSMAKHLWLPWHRRLLFRRALGEVSAALEASPGDRAGYLAIRGSIHLKLWHFRQAVRDYEAVVALRAEHRYSASAQGEAWVELAWGYLLSWRFSRARSAFRQGLALMRQDFERDPMSRLDFLIRAFLKSALGFALVLDFDEARRAAVEGCRLAHQQLAYDQLRGLRGWICKIVNPRHF